MLQSSGLSIKSIKIIHHPKTLLKKQSITSVFLGNLYLFQSILSVDYRSRTGFDYKNILAYSDILKTAFSWMTYVLVLVISHTNWASLTGLLMNWLSQFIICFLYLLALKCFFNFFYSIIIWHFSLFVQTLFSFINFTP